MAKIQKMPKSRLRNNELLAFGRSVENKILSIGASELSVESYFTTFQEALQAYDDSILRVIKSALTAEMETVDKTRNSMQSGLFSQIRTFTNHYDAEAKAAALRLIPLIDRFKGTTQVSYNDQTGLIYNLVQQAESDTYKDDIATLGLTDWVAELKKINQQCEDLTNARREEKGERNMTLKVSQTRPDLEAAYDKLVNVLNAYAIVDGDEKYLSLFAWWNAVIDEYRVIFSLRYGKGEGGQTDSGSSNQPETGTEEETPSEDDKPEEL